MEYVGYENFGVGDHLPSKQTYHPEIGGGGTSPSKMGIKTKLGIDQHIRRILRDHGTEVALGTAGIALAGAGGKILYNRRKRGLSAGSGAARKGLPFKRSAQLVDLAKMNKTSKAAILSGYAREMVDIQDPNYALTKKERRALYSKIRKELVAKLK